jgi:hypothetical protein
MFAIKSFWKLPLYIIFTAKKLNVITSFTYSLSRRAEFSHTFNPDSCVMNLPVGQQ